MELAWRTPLKKYIEEHYIQRPQEWFDLDLSPSGRLNMTIVSNRFAKLPLEERREQIRQLLHELNAPTSTGFLSLYTPDEAESIRLSRPPVTEDKPVYNWLDLAQWAVNVEDQPKMRRREPRIPRTVVFYSFKGGVGRTTALIQVAAILAMRGRKVVAVDLDLEAPGLSSALDVSPWPKYGIVDYFYERSYMPEDVEPEISITEIFGEVRILDAPGRLFLVPAGSLDLDYLAKIDDLRASRITTNGEDLWSLFYREITEQLQPDIILVDSRTGINEWGALSLLRAADKVILFLYPNEQNSRGVGLLLEALMNTIPISFVFSPVPFVNEGGMEMVTRQWAALQTARKNSGVNQETQIETAEPIVIPYIPEVAMTSTYPVEDLLPYYTDIANVIDEDMNAIYLSRMLTGTERRKIIESLTFPEIDAKTGTNLETLFQRTADFEKLLDRGTFLIRGCKGTGKSTLYWLLLKHKKMANKLSRTRGHLNNVTCISAHGGFHPGPTMSDFQQIDQAIRRSGETWEGFWHSYLLLRIYMENHLQELLEERQRNSLQSLLNKVPTEADLWGAEHTHALIEMVTDPTLDGQVKELLGSYPTQKMKKDQSFWFLYDDLEKDIEDEVRQKALTGLFQCVFMLRGFPAIKFKIFLREDVWHRLTFENKSYFKGRDLLLQWTWIDFLRLALRLSLQSEKFKKIVDSISPIESIDQADTEEADQAIQLLWGNQSVYSWLTDANSTTFPHSLKVFLREATKAELQASQEQQALITDRLLRTESVQEGLMKAAEERCDEIREEYPELRSFFDFLAGKKVQTVTEELHRAWLETRQPAQPEWQDFKTFVGFLESIGLIGTTRQTPSPSGTGSIEINRVGSIYMHGFHMI